jgi:hypothetical protein
MGQVRGKKALEKKFKDVLEARDLIEDALDFDKKLASIKSHLKEFEKDLDPFKDKEQKKVRDFKR